ncbi:MAG: hypothetical protein ABFD46_04360 [Armatimonadota bacterium]
MKKIFQSSIAILCVCLLAMVLVALTGCGNKGNEQAAGTSAESQPAAQGTPATPGTGAPPELPGVGNQAGNPATTASATPATSATTTPGTTSSAASTADQSAGGFPKLTFSAVKKNSPVKVVTDRQNGVVIRFFHFKYSDWNGIVNVCELPEVESKAMRTAGNWVVTFDAYKIKSATAKTSKKKVRTRLTDFPFVSPKQQSLPSLNGTLGSPSGTSSSGGLMLPGT